MECFQKGTGVLVGVSGGADSLTLLKLLTGPLLFVPKPDFLLAVYVDMGFQETGEWIGVEIKKIL